MQIEQCQVLSSVRIFYPIVTLEFVKRKIYKTGKKTMRSQLNLFLNVLTIIAMMFRCVCKNLYIQ